MVEVSREQHALIHWGYKCNDLEPLLEVCNPPQWVIDMIPLGDNRDSAAASVIALGEIEQIDVSGENNPNWKGGISVGDNRKAYKTNYQTPEYKAYLKEYQQKPKYKAYDKKRKSSPEYKAYQKAYRQTPEIVERKKEYRQTPEYKEYQKAYKQTPQYKEKKREDMKAHYLRRKLEKQQGQGTLKQFIG